MMIEGRIQHILDTLHHSEGRTFWDFDRASGDPWSGYTRNGEPKKPAGYDEYKQAEKEKVFQVYENELATFLRLNVDKSARNGAISPKKPEGYDQYKKEEILKTFREYDLKLIKYHRAIDNNEKDIPKESMKPEGYTLSHSGSDAHTYDGLSHWRNELYFESSSQKFYNYSEFGASSYNSEPQKTTTEITEDEIIKILSGKRNWEVRVSISKKII